MNLRTFLPWVALLTVYNLAIAALVIYFMAHCESVAGSVLGERMPRSPHAPSSLVTGLSE